MRESRPTTNPCQRLVRIIVVAGLLPQLVFLVLMANWGGFFGEQESLIAFRVSVTIIAIAVYGLLGASILKVISPVSRIHQGLFIALYALVTMFNVAAIVFTISEGTYATPQQKVWALALIGYFTAMTIGLVKLALTDLRSNSIDE